MNPDALFPTPANRSPKNLYGRYKAWVHANSSSIAAVEGTLSSLTWLLPDRFSESELTLEAVHSLLGFVSLFHDKLLSTPPSGPQPPQLPWPFWLASVQQVEVLVEMGANSLEKRGHLDKYTPLAVLEAIKALLRLLTFKRSGARILTDGGMTASLPSAKNPEAKIHAVCDALARFHSRHCSDESDTQAKDASAEPLSSIFEGSRLEAEGSGSSGSAESGEPDTSTSRQLWWERPWASRRHSAAASPEVHAGERLAQRKLLEAHVQWRETAGQQLLATGEIIHILRSLAYVLALRRWGRRSWRPWFLSLGLEALSAYLVSLAAAAAHMPRKKGLASPSSDSLGILQSLQTFQWTPVEQRELMRRRLLFVYYLVKSPFFDRFTGKAVRLGQGVLRPIPLVGSLADKAAEIVFGVQQYYTYTNAS